MAHSAHVLMAKWMAFWHMYSLDGVHSEKSQCWQSQFNGFEIYEKSSPAEMHHYRSVFMRH